MQTLLLLPSQDETGPSRKMQALYWARNQGHITTMHSPAPAQSPIGPLEAGLELGDRDEAILVGVKFVKERPQHVRFDAFFPAQGKVQRSPCRPLLEDGARVEMSAASSAASPSARTRALAARSRYWCSLVLVRPSPPLCKMMWGKQPDSAPFITTVSQL